MLQSQDLKKKMFEFGGKRNGAKFCVNFKFLFVKNVEL